MTTLCVILGLLAAVLMVSLRRQTRRRLQAEADAVRLARLLEMARHPAGRNRQPGDAPLTAEERQAWERAVDDLDANGRTP